MNKKTKKKNVQARTSKKGEADGDKQPPCQKKNWKRKKKAEFLIKEKGKKSKRLPIGWAGKKICEKRTAEAKKQKVDPKREANGNVKKRVLVVRGGEQEKNTKQDLRKKSTKEWRKGTLETKIPGGYWKKKKNQKPCLWDLGQHE